MLVGGIGLQVNKKNQEIKAPVIHNPFPAGLQSFMTTITLHLLPGKRKSIKLNRT